MVERMRDRIWVGLGWIMAVIVGLVLAVATLLGSAGAASAAGTWAAYLSAAPQTPAYITSGPDGSGGQTTWIGYNGSINQYAWCRGATEGYSDPNVAYWKNGQWNVLALPLTVDPCAPYATAGKSTIGGMMVGPNGSLWVVESDAAISLDNGPGWIIQQWSWATNSWSTVASHVTAGGGNPYWGPQALEPGPNNTAVVSASGPNGPWTTGETYGSLFEVDASGNIVAQIPDIPDGGTSGSDFVTFAGATVGPDGNLWATAFDGNSTWQNYALFEWNGGAWTAVPNGALPTSTYSSCRESGGRWYCSTPYYSTYSMPLWGPDARLWFPGLAMSPGTQEWTGNGFSQSIPTLTNMTLDVAGISPDGNMVAAAGTQLYELQGGPTVSGISAGSIQLQGGWSTWGQVEAATTMNAGLAAQGYDGNSSAWGSVNYQLQDQNPDGGTFNTATVAGGAIGSAATSLPTQFGHLYYITAVANYVDPMDPQLVVGSTSGGGVNYYLPSNTGGVSQISAVTATSITVDWPTVWKNSTQQMYVGWEPESLVSQNNWSGMQYGTHIAYPQHSYIITGLAPDTTYWINLTPVEPSGGPWFAVGGWTVTTDSAPSGTLQINSGQHITSSADVTLTVSAQNANTPPVAVRFSNDNTNWSSWKPLTDTPLSGAPVTGAAGTSGYYFAANTSLAANQAGTDYMHFNHFLYSENDAQINFPYGEWPTGPDGEAPQAVLNSGSPTNTGNDWGTIWQGYVYAPVSGTYTFATPSDDGATLDLNGQEIINDWQQQGIPATTSENGTITLSAGQWYPFMIYYENGGGPGGIQLEWQQPPTTTVPNPQYSVVPANDLWSLDPSAVNPTNVTATGSFNWTLPTVVSGTETVYAQVLDLNGTVSSTVTASVLEINNSNAPVVSMVLNNGQQSTTSTSVPVTLSVQGSGFATGLGKMQFQVDGGAWSTLTAYTSTTNVTIPNTPGVYTITVQVEDPNSLTSQATGKITLLSSQLSTQTGGTGSVLAVTGGVVTTVGGQPVQVVQGGEVTLTFAPPSVSGSAPTQMMASHDGTTWSPWLPYATSMSATLTTDELNSVAVRFKYPDGSESQVYTLSVLPIVTAPTLSASWQGNATATTTSSMTAVISVSDSVLPATDLSYSVNGGISWTAVPGASFTASVPIAAGVNTVTVEVKDPAGNVADAVLTGWGL